MIKYFCVLFSKKHLGSGKSLYQVVKMWKFVLLALYTFTIVETVLLIFQYLKNQLIEKLILLVYFYKIIAQIHVLAVKQLNCTRYYCLEREVYPYIYSCNNLNDYFFLKAFTHTLCKL